MTKAERELRAFLQIGTTAREKFCRRKPPGMAYWSVEDYILKEGRFFAPQPLPEGYMQRPMKACFYNSYRLAACANGALRFCEGYASGSLIPVHHAWCVDREDRVVDPTWDEPGTAYLGVILDLDQVRDVAKRHDQFSVIDNWMDRWPLLREESEAA